MTNPETNKRRVNLACYDELYGIREQNMATDDFTRPGNTYTKSKAKPHTISMKKAIKAYTLPQIYKRKKEYIMDDSIDAFKFLEYISLENVSVSISEPPGTGKTSFMFLTKDLPDYQFLKVFSSPTIKLSTYPQHELEYNLEGRNKQPKLDSEVTITKQNIFDLYSRTIITFIDLREIVNKADKEKISSSFLECFVVLTMNAAIIIFIEDNTKLNTEQIGKLNNLSESNSKFRSKIKNKDTQHRSETLKSLKTLYKEITEYIHGEITSKKLKKLPQHNLNLLNEEDKTTDYTVNKFIIMIDEVNILQSRIDYSSDEKFTEIVNNMVIGMLAYKASTKKNRILPTSIQYVFSSVLPLCQISNKMEYPVLEDFTEFNRRKIHSFGEVTRANLFKLMPTSFDNLKSSKLNLEKIIYGLKVNKLDILPFLERGLPDSEISDLNEKWNECVIETRKILNIPTEQDEVIDIKLIVISICSFLIGLYKQPKYNIGKDYLIADLYLNYVYNLESKMVILLHDGGNGTDSNDVVERDTDNNSSAVNPSQSTDKNVIKQQSSVSNIATDTESKSDINRKVNRTILANLKLNTRRILSFLMADNVEGSLRVSRSYHHSSEMEIADFWTIYEQLKKDEFSLDFPLPITQKNLKDLFENNIEKVTGNKFKFLWVLYNLGYIYADSYKFHTNDTSPNHIGKVVVLDWTNQQKELAFKNMISTYEQTLSFQKHSSDDYHTKIEELLNEKFLTSIICKIGKQIEKTQRSVFFKHRKHKENDDTFDKRIIEKKPEEIHEVQFESEFYSLFNTYIEQEIKKTWKKLNASDIKQRFYTKRQHEMFRFEELDDGTEKARIQKPDIYGFLRFHKVQETNDEIEDKSIYFCIELKRNIKVIKGFEVFYDGTKDYTQIESLKNKNVFYVAASIVEPNVNGGMQMKDKGFKMPYLSVLLGCDDDKENLKKFRR